MLPCEKDLCSSLYARSNTYSPEKFSCWNPGPKYRAFILDSAQQLHELPPLFIIPQYPEILLKQTRPKIHIPPLVLRHDMRQHRQLIHTRPPDKLRRAEPGAKITLKQPVQLRPRRQQEVPPGFDLRAVEDRRLACCLVDERREAADEVVVDLLQRLTDQQSGVCQRGRR